MWTSVGQNFLKNKQTNKKTTTNSDNIATMVDVLSQIFPIFK